MIGHYKWHSCQTFYDSFDPIVCVSSSLTRAQFQLFSNFKSGTFIRTLEFLRSNLAQFSQTNLNILFSCVHFADQQFQNGCKTVRVDIEQHISELNSIEMAQNSSLEANDITEMKRKCQMSANSNGTDEKDNLQSNMSFDALENTKLAVAQFAAAALSKGVNESSIKDLTMLQSALFTLQHQQVFQMQLIEQLQYQLAKTNARKDKKWKPTKSDDGSEPNPSVCAEDESDFKPNPGEW